MILIPQSYLESETALKFTSKEAPFGVDFEVNGTRYNVKEGRNGGLIIRKEGPGSDRLKILPTVTNEIEVQ